MSALPYLVVVGMAGVLAACLRYHLRHPLPPCDDEFADIEALQRQQAARAALARATRTEQHHGK